MKIAFILLFLAGQAVAQSKIFISDEKFKPLKTGVSTREFADSSRSNWLGTGPRPIRSVIWYPAGQGGTPEIIDDPGQISVPTTAIRDANVSSLKKKYPLILISHGSQGNAQQMRWLGYYLASRGYIAVAINHNGTDIEERKTDLLSLSDFCMWERPKDLSVVLNKMLNDSVFSSKIDTSRIAAAGFSLGGATVIWVAGAIFTIAELGKREPAPPPIFKASIDRLIELKKTDPIIMRSFEHSADSYKDNRIKAVFALAPAIGQGFTKEGLKNISIPVQIAVGDADVVAPISSNAGHYAQHIPTSKKLIILPGERGHYMKPAEGTERAAELRELSLLAYHFFEGVFK